MIIIHVCVTWFKRKANQGSANSITKLNKQGHGIMFSFVYIKNIKSLHTGFILLTS